MAINAGASAGSAQGGRSRNPIDRIREADLKADLFTLAGDEMRGREGGTLDELTASMWIAERARQAGLQPAGDNGTLLPVLSARALPRVAQQLGHAGRQGAADGPRRRAGRHRALADVDAPLVTSRRPTRWPGGDDRQGARGPLCPAAGAAGRGRTGRARIRVAALRTWVRGIQRASQRRRPRRSSRSSRTRQRSVEPRGVLVPARQPTRSIPTARPRQRVPARGVPAALREGVGPRRPARAPTRG